MLLNGIFVIIPVIGAVICAFLNKQKQAPGLLANIILLFGFLISLHIFFMSLGQEWFFGEDVLSAFMLIMIYMVALAVAFFAVFAASTKRRGSYFAILLVITAGMAGVVCSQDLFTLYVFLEVVAVASFVLIAFYNREKSTEGAIRYFYLSSIASAFILFAISLLLLYTGDTTYEGLVKTILQTQGNSAPLNIILGTLAVALMIKTGLFPFHSWTPDAYESASSPISALLAGIVTKVAGTYALVLVCMLLSIVNFGIEHNTVGKAIMWFGLGSIVFGALAAQEQKDFKRMLAYSSISQMGYITIAAALATPLAMAGALFHIFNHATFKTLLFFCAGNVKKATGTTAINEMRGLQEKMPYTSATATIGMLATAGLPPFSGFWSKLFIIAALWQAGFIGMSVTALFASVLTLAYFLKLQRGMFFGSASKNIANVKEQGMGFLIPCFALAFIIIAVGIYFPFIYNNFLSPFIKVLQ
ncbi:MAG: NADH-quinone oxidoreductase subunit L [Elusimicrobiota bacterium]|jgi:multicomponent Na+:H+ antiporter subunit D|nr:NADH-quinone oxidoreductase subunit L [Elusimicrobiota bacterium]